jgi:apolipoprotein N-acyltransferase
MITPRHLPIVWLLSGFGLFVFTRTTTFVPVAILIAPVLILRFMRTQPAYRAILLALVGFTASLTISLWGLFPLDDPLQSLVFNVIRSLMVALVLALPYVSDRLIEPRIGGFAATLVFPVSATAFYFLDSSFGPLDGTGIFFAYTQYGNLPLVQLMSIAGLWGLVFLQCWFASVFNWAWSRDFRWPDIRRGVSAFAAIVVLVLVYGGAKTSPFFDPEGDTVRIAAVTLFPEDATREMSFETILKKRILSPFEATIARIEELTQRAASSGAKIVVFQEYAIIVDEDHQSRAVEAFREIASTNRVFLSVTYTALPERGKGENRSLFIGDDGQVLANYLKHNLFFGERPFMKQGPAEIPVVDTPYGRIGVTICRDFEFPAYTRQAGKMDVDIVLSPSYDFPKGVTPSNTYNQMLRAVEGGFNLVRTTNNGLSVAIDYHGRVLSSMNYFTASNEVMYADVPTQGIRTLYVMIGDALAWLCLVGFCVFVGLAFKSRRGGRGIGEAPV